MSMIQAADCGIGIEGKVGYPHTEWHVHGGAQSAVIRSTQRPCSPSMPVPLPSFSPQLHTASVLRVWFSAGLCAARGSPEPASMV